MSRGMNPRSKWEIISDMLKEISEEEGGVKKTRIMQKAYLDWRNFERHFDFLQEHDFVRNAEYILDCQSVVFREETSHNFRDKLGIHTFTG